MEAVTLLLTAAAALMYLSDEGVKAEDDLVVTTLVANGTRVPGGYVMPAGGDITFTCSHNGSSSKVLFWAIAITNSNNSIHDTTANTLQDTPGLSSSATSLTDNPVDITISNLQLANNGSTVKCETKQEGTPAIILVEGVPGCAAVDVSATTDSSLRVTMRPGQQSGLLPVWFRVVVTSGDCHTRSFHTKSNNITIPPCRQSGAEHNVSVLPCNAAGCNKGCPAYLINHTTSEGPAHEEMITMTSTTKTTTEKGGTSATIVVSLMAIIVVLLLSLLALTAITIALAMTLRAKVKRCTCTGGASKRTGEVEQGEVPQGDDDMTLSEKTESQMEEVNKPTEFQEDVYPTYVSIEPSKVL